MQGYAYSICWKHFKAAVYFSQFASLYFTADAQFWEKMDWFKVFLKYDFMHTPHDPILLFSFDSGLLRDPIIYLSKAQAIIL